MVFAELMDIHDNGWPWLSSCLINSPLFRSLSEKVEVCGQAPLQVQVALSIFRRVSSVPFPVTGVPVSSSKQAHPPKKAVQYSAARYEVKMGLPGYCRSNHIDVDACGCDTKQFRKRVRRSNAIRVRSQVRLRCCPVQAVHLVLRRASSCRRFRTFPLGLPFCRLNRTTRLQVRAQSMLHRARSNRRQSIEPSPADQSNGNKGVKPGHPAGRVPDGSDAATGCLSV